MLYIFPTGQVNLPSSYIIFGTNTELEKDPDSIYSIEHPCRQRQCSWVIKRDYIEGRTLFYHFDTKDLPVGCIEKGLYGEAFKVIDDATFISTDRDWHRYPYPKQSIVMILLCEWLNSVHEYQDRGGLEVSMVTGPCTDNGADMSNNTICKERG